MIVLICRQLDQIRQTDIQIDYFFIYFAKAINREFNHNKNEYIRKQFGFYVLEDSINIPATDTVLFRYDGDQPMTEKDFQSDASQMALSANHISSSRAPSNHRATSKYLV